jgi:hypothetical protein
MNSLGRDTKCEGNPFLAFRRCRSALEFRAGSGGSGGVDRGITELRFENNHCL